MTNEKNELTPKQKAKLKELKAVEGQMKKLVKELGLVPMSEAAELHDASRQALIQLANAGRLDKVKLLEAVMGDKAHTFFFRDQIVNFKPRRS